MNFSYYDLGNCRSGEIVEVSLDKQANVRLMDSSNYSSFKSGRRHRYYGGLAKRSPASLTVPRAGHWYITIDLGGHRGSVRHSIRRLPGRLPTLENTPLGDVVSFADRASDAEKEYDVFISHASEDKEAVATPLARFLQDQGISVWIDDLELRIGDSLRRRIDNGLAKSRFGVVVFSYAFFQKGWTNYELDGLVTRAVNDEQVLLPIWHRVSKQEVIDYSPSLADKVARNTSNYTIEEIGIEIADLIREARLK
ncbi:MAG: DUF1883 domain-containing protein [Pseudomonadota bacterium]